MVKYTSNRMSSLPPDKIMSKLELLHRKYPTTDIHAKTLKKKLAIEAKAQKSVQAEIDRSTIIEEKTASSIESYHRSIKEKKKVLREQQQLSKEIDKQLKRQIAENERKKVALKQNKYNWVLPQHDEKMDNDNDSGDESMMPSVSRSPIIPEIISRHVMKYIDVLANKKDANRIRKIMEEMQPKQIYDVNCPDHKIYEHCQLAEIIGKTLYENICFFHCDKMVGALMQHKIVIMDPRELKYLFDPILAKFKKLATGTDNCMQTLRDYNIEDVYISFVEGSTDIVMTIRGSKCNINIQLHAGLDRLCRIIPSQLYRVCNVENTRLLSQEHLEVFRAFIQYFHTLKCCNETFRTLSHTMFRKSEFHEHVVLFNCSPVVKAFELSDYKPHIRYFTVSELYRAKRIVRHALANDLPITHVVKDKFQRYNKWRDAQFKHVENIADIKCNSILLDYLVNNPCEYEYNDRVDMITHMQGNAVAYIPKVSTPGRDEMITHDSRELCCDIIIVTGPGDEIKQPIPIDDHVNIDIARLIRKHPKKSLSRSCIILVPNRSDLELMVQLHLVHNEGYRYGELMNNSLVTYQVSNDILSRLISCLDELQKVSHTIYSRYDANKPMTHMSVKQKSQLGRCVYR